MKSFLMKRLISWEALKTSISYVKTKIVFGIISNWIVVVIFNVKLYFVTSVEEQRLRGKRDTVHNWVFYINSSSMIEDVIIHEHLK